MIRLLAIATVVAVLVVGAVLAWVALNEVAHAVRVLLP